MTDQTRITQWRFKAEELRTLSDVMKVQAARESMARTAAQWDRMADNAEVANRFADDDRLPHFPDFAPPN
jgi:hypothetical protein